MEVCVAHLAEMKNTYIILIGNRQGKTFLLLYQSHSVVFLVSKAAIAQFFLFEYIRFSCYSRSTNVQYSFICHSRTRQWPH
jgi:hypothetical protein